MSSPTLTLAAMLGNWEILLIFLVILLLFGGAKLPGLARGLGQSIKEFKKASREAENDDTKPVSTETKKIESSETETKTK